MADETDPFPIAGTRSQMEEWIDRRAAQDPGFRQRLLSNPRTTLASVVGKPVPPDLRMIVVEETPTKRYVLLRQAGEFEGPPTARPEVVAGVNVEALEEDESTFYLILRPPAQRGA